MNEDSTEQSGQPPPNKQSDNGHGCISWLMGTHSCLDPRCHTLLVHVSFVENAVKESPPQWKELGWKEQTRQYLLTAVSRTETHPRLGGSGGGSGRGPPPNFGSRYIRSKNIIGTMVPLRGISEASVTWKKSGETCLMKLATVTEDAMTDAEEVCWRYRIFWCCQVPMSSVTSRRWFRLPLGQVGHAKKSHFNRCLTCDPGKRGLGATTSAIQAWLAFLHHQTVELACIASCVFNPKSLVQFSASDEGGSSRSSVDCIKCSRWGHLVPPAIFLGHRFEKSSHCIG